jgi:hypothetical protein
VVSTQSTTRYESGVFFFFFFFLYLETKPIILLTDFRRQIDRIAGGKKNYGAICLSSPVKSSSIQTTHI